MGKLTVESIINIYGTGVKEIKVYNELKRTNVEDFLQADPVAFTLSEEPDVLRIYIDKASSYASLDGKLEDDNNENDNIIRTADKRMTELDLKNKIEELETELQQYKILVSEIKEYIKGYGVFDYLHNLFGNFGL